MHGQERFGFSLIGVLITVGLIAVLFAIVASSMQGVKGGANTPVQQNQATTFADREYIRQMGMALFTSAQSHNGRFLSPTLVANSDDKSLDTTANFFSAMIAERYVHPQMLVSANEASPYVDVYENYDVTAYNPAAGTFWDPGFKADLHQLSHTSYGHEVFYGERFRRNWSMSGGSSFALLGNRGPENGVPSQDSFACDVTGVWGGNMVYADGHVEFHRTTAPAPNDNFFKLESGESGDDMIITFTREIWSGGFEMQFD